MSESRRYYAVVGYQKVGEWAQDGEMISFNYKKKVDALAAVTEIQDQLKKSEELRIFLSKEEADNFALDVAIFRKEDFNKAESNGVKQNMEARLFQPAVVEISLPSKKIDEKAERASELPDILVAEDVKPKNQNDPAYCLKPRVDTVKYPHTMLKNDPASYIAHKAWLGDTLLGSVQKFPVSYQEFFPAAKPAVADKKNDVFTSIKGLFDDYINPKKWYAKHHINRHHELLARELKIIITRHQHTPSVLLDMLITKREECILKFKNVQSTVTTYGYTDFMKGSFKNRLDFAINQLKDALTPEFAPDTKLKSGAGPVEMTTFKKK